MVEKDRTGVLADIKNPTRNGAHLLENTQPLESGSRVPAEDNSTVLSGIQDTGADSIYFISPQATDYLAPPLYAYVNLDAGEELREILGHSLQSLTHELKQELFSKAPTDTNECAQAVGIWITRLNVIKSGLAGFPMPVDGGGISNTMESLTIAPPPDGTAQAPQARPSQASIKLTACLERDNYQCIITGRKISDGSSTEVVPLIPFAFANHPYCRDLDFWKMLDMFFGSEAIDTLFAGLLERVDNLENLVTLDSSIHAMFNSGGSLDFDTKSSLERSDSGYK